MNLAQINKIIQQTQQQIERGKQTVAQVREVANSVANVVNEVKQVIEPAKAAVQQIEQMLESVKIEPTNAANLAQLSAAVMTLHAVHQAGRPDIMGTLSQFNKAIVALVMSALIIIETFTGYNIGITEPTLITVLAILTPILVWLFPNYPR